MKRENKASANSMLVCQLNQQVTKTRRKALKNHLVSDWFLTHLNADSNTKFNSDTSNLNFDRYSNFLVRCKHYLDLLHTL